MTATEAKTAALGTVVYALFVKEQPALEVGNVNVPGALEDMAKLEKAAVGANADQEAAKRAQHAATERAVEAMRAWYVAVSGYLDMAIAAVGKDTDAARNFRKLRSDMEREARNLPAPTPVPLPVAKPAQ